MEAIRYENSEIDERIIRAVTEIGYEEMTPIQQSAIPALLEGRDIIGQAQTGTGKTAAFGIPLVQMIDRKMSACRQSCFARPENWPSRQQMSCAATQNICRV